MVPEPMLMTAKMKENGVIAGKHILTDNKKILVMWLKTLKNMGKKLRKLKIDPSYAF